MTFVLFYMRYILKFTLKQMKIHPQRKKPDTEEYILYNSIIKILENANYSVQKQISGCLAGGEGGRRGLELQRDMCNFGGMMKMFCIVVICTVHVHIC